MLAKVRVWVREEVLRILTESVERAGYGSMAVGAVVENALTLHALDHDPGLALALIPRPDKESPDA